jgi:nicotinamidase-related amidase
MEVLLLIDIQNDYFKGGAMRLVGSEEAAENASMLLQRFRSEKLPVIHIRHLATRPGSSFFLPDTLGAEINKAVSPLENEQVIVKHFPNSFRETELHALLQSGGITEIMVCGMMTHMCVDATVRAAKDLGYTITLIGDACATRDLDINGNVVKAADVHSCFLAALNGFYAQVISSNDILHTPNHLIS